MRACLTADDGLVVAEITYNFQKFKSYAYSDRLPRKLYRDRPDRIASDAPSRLLTLLSYD